MIFMAPKVIYQRCIVHPWSIRRLQEQRETPQVMSSAPICTEMWARRGTQLLTRWKGSGEIWSHLVILVGSGWFWLVLVGQFLSWFHCCGCFSGVWRTWASSTRMVWWQALVLSVYAHAIIDNQILWEVWECRMIRMLMLSHTLGIENCCCRPLLCVTRSILAGYCGQRYGESCSPHYLRGQRSACAAHVQRMQLWRDAEVNSPHHFYEGTKARSLMPLASLALRLSWNGIWSVIYVIYVIYVIWYTDDTHEVTEAGWLQWSAVCREMNSILMLFLVDCFCGKCCGYKSVENVCCMFVWFVRFLRAHVADEFLEALVADKRLRHRLLGRLGHQLHMVNAADWRHAGRCERHTEDAKLLQTSRWFLHIVSYCYILLW